MKVAGFSTCAEQRSLNMERQVAATGAGSSGLYTSLPRYGKASATPGSTCSSESTNTKVGSRTSCSAQWHRWYHSCQRKGAGTRGGSSSRESASAEEMALTLGVSGPAEGEGGQPSCSMVLGGDSS